MEKLLYVLLIISFPAPECVFAFCVAQQKLSRSELALLWELKEVFCV